MQFIRNMIDHDITDCKFRNFKKLHHLGHLGQVVRTHSFFLLASVAQIAFLIDSEGGARRESLGTVWDEGL
jgi:hypothetical protein